MQGSTFNNVGGALSALDASTTANTQTIALLQSGQGGPSVSNNAAGAPVASATGSNASATGFGSNASGGNSTALGNEAVASAANATALGQGSSATAANAVALGQGSVANQANTVSVGAVGAERKLVNVAAGTLASGSTEAATGGQLYETNLAVSANAGHITALQNGTEGLFRANNTAGLAAASASGTNAVAGGFGAVASGADTSAVGTGARATQAGDTAFGAGAVASGDPSTALGNNSLASGDNSVAVGANATASASGAVALGQASTAGYANSVAIGQGVATTRANQVMIGSASNTYSLPGVASAASLAAQTGPVQYVTSDANGNLATTRDIATAGSVAALDGRVDGLTQNVKQLQGDIKKSYEGTSIAIALAGAALPDNKRYALSANIGAFRGESAFGGILQVRATENLVFNGGLGVGFNRGGVGGRVGATFAW